MALRDTTPYSGTSSLLMGDGTPAKIVSIGSRNLSTPLKLLCLSNVLCVPSIRKNLLSVSQFAKDNEVFFEFHPTYCVIKDIKTNDTLLKGHIRDGLYHFSMSAVDSFVAHTKLQNKPVDALCLLYGIIDLVTLLVLLFIVFYKNVILLSISLVLMVYVLLVKKKSHISCPFLFQLLYINLLS